MTAQANQKRQGIAGDDSRRGVAKPDGGKRNGESRQRGRFGRRRLKRDRPSVRAARSKQRKNGASELFCEIAADIRQQQGVGIDDVTSGAEQRAALANEAAQEKKGVDARKRLNNNTKKEGSHMPWMNRLRAAAKDPGKGRIKDEARFAKAVIGPGRPARKEYAFLPLEGHIQPGTRVEPKIVARSAAQPEKGQDDGGETAGMIRQRQCPDGNSRLRLLSGGNGGWPVIEDS